MQNQIPSKNLNEDKASIDEGMQSTILPKAFRYGAILPLAAVMTIGLMVSMAALIATEFSPQEKTETASFEINPLEDDTVEPPRTEKPDPLKKVETPPPPPTVATFKTAEVSLPVVKIVGKKTEFDIDKLDLGQNFKTVSIKRDLAPVFRVPPVFPARFMQGDVSGYCRVRFDLNPEGKPFNIDITICTDSQLRTATIKSVRKWKYTPQVEDGRPVTRSGLETTIRFDLTDEREKVLPLPNGF